MDVRKYESFSMHDAIKLVKKELGNDAVILSTREKPSPDGKGKLVEVVAARSVTSKDLNEKVPFQKSRILSPEAALLARKADFPQVRTKPEVTVVKGSPTLSGFKNDVRSTLQDAENQAMRRGSADKSALEDIRLEIAKVKKELEALPHINVGEQVEEIKVILHELIRDQYRRGAQQTHEYLSDIVVRLRSGGVEESFLTELSQMVSSLPIPKGPDGMELQDDKLKEFYLGSAIRVMLKAIKVTGPWRQAEGKQRFICLVGPTGVGKTTSIAKLAARLKLEEGHKVALMSMDSFRIAAADQLRIYAKILDCPFAEVSDAAEVVTFVEKHIDYDYIFIDTAGRSFRSVAQQEGLRKLKSSSLPIEFHLALSSTMKQRDLDENLKAYRFLNLESLIFTKLDESWSFGEIFNCNMKSRIPLSHFSIGQRVPEDLEVAAKERIVEKLFRL